MTGSWVLVTLDELGEVGPTTTQLAAHLGGRSRVATDFTDLGRILDEEPDTVVLVVAVERCDKVHMERLAVVHEELPWVQKVLLVERPGGPMVVGARSTIEATKLLARAGIADVLSGRVDPEELSQAVKRAVDLADTLLRWASDGTKETTPEGTVHAVTSARGGAGRTFLAVNIAAYLARIPDARVCLVDLDVTLGDAAAVLGLQPRFTIADLAVAPDGLDLLVDSYSERHGAGFAVLAAPGPDEAGIVTVDDAIRIVRAARRAFDHVVVDLQPATSKLALALLAEADQRWCVAKSDIPSLRTLTSFLAGLETAGLSAADVRIVLNMVAPGCGIEPEEIDEILPHGLAAALPYSRRAIRATNDGTTIFAVEPHGDLARRLHTLLAPLVGVDAPTMPSERRESRWRRALARA
jgi:pilus assembly protein CpaE